MANKVFNYTNQKLNAEKLREVVSFNSNNFGGIISESSPITITNNQVILPASEGTPITFMGGGLILNQTSSESFTFVQINHIWYLEVTLDPKYANITTDELIEILNKGTDQETIINKVKFDYTWYSYFNKDDTYTYFTVVTEASGNPSINQYYEYAGDTYSLSSDTEVDSTKTYYYKIEASKFSFIAPDISTDTFTYFGNTLWVSDTKFIIPIAAIFEDEILPIVSVRKVKDYEGLLSAEAYARLKHYCDGTFVWSVGGREPVIAPDGTTHRKGDIGGLNITEDTIYNKINRGTDSNPDYSDPVGIQNLSIRNIANELNDIDTKLVVDSTGNISTSQNYITPVIHGGTGANNKVAAKNNLGIRWGTNNGKSPVEQSPYAGAQEGDIYLWIIE